MTHIRRDRAVPSHRQPRWLRPICLVVLTRRVDVGSRRVGRLGSLGRKDRQAAADRAWRCGRPDLRLRRKRLAVGFVDSLQIYDTATWDSTTGAPSPPSIWFPYDFAPDGDHLIGVGPEIGNIGMFDPATSETANLVPTLHDGETKNLALSDDGSAIASAGGDGYARIWSTTTGELIQRDPIG